MKVASAWRNNMLSNALHQRFVTLMVDYFPNKRWRNYRVISKNITARTDAT